MRWIWIDRVVELVPRERLVAIKHLSLAEEHLHDHFGSCHEVAGGPGPGWWSVEAAGVSGGGGSAAVVECGGALPVMPASLIIEGMAQTAGILVGHANEFREKPVLAKIGRAELMFDAVAGQTLRHTASMVRLDRVGAAVSGTVEILVMRADGSTVAHRAAEIELMFSHLDRNMGGQVFPEHNFVFSEALKVLLETSGVR